MQAKVIGTLFAQRLNEAINRYQPVPVLGAVLRAMHERGAQSRLPF